jgi:hypothetical protein
MNEREQVEYVFTNWGDKVYVIDDSGVTRQGVITEYDPSIFENTKVIYEKGGFDWYNRDELEKSLRAREYAKRDSTLTPIE